MKIFTSHYYKNLFIRFLKTEKGVSLVELLVVTGIIAVLSSALLISYKSGDQQFALQRAAHKLSQDTRMAQSMAGVEELSCAGSSYGYGLYFKESEPGEYILFADCDQNRKHSAVGDTDTIIELEEGVQIKDLKKKVGANVVDVTEISVVFEPPDPLVFIENGGIGDSLIIILCLKEDNSKTKTITINKIGMIDID